jgi:hypothetical protein
MRPSNRCRAGNPACSRLFRRLPGFALLGLSVTCLLLGENEGRRKVEVSKTENVDFPTNGTLRLQNSTGELVIEGWDQPGVEITTTKSSKEEYLSRDRAKAAQDLDRVQVSTKRTGDELVVTTEFPHHRAFPYVTSLQTVTNFDIEYRVKVPRNAKLIVKHDDGEVHIDDVTGNIQVTVRQGLIALRLVSEVPPAVDAKSDLGSVNSDFAGNEIHHPRPFGHQFVQGTAPGNSAAQNLHLKIGFGDIIILKAHEPKAAGPAT